MQNGKLYRQPKWELGIFVRESGSWPTPTVSDTDAVNHAQMFPTPTVQDGENDGGPSQYKRHSIPLNAIVKDSPQTTGQLNPLWVEWLMGYPIGWTDLKALGMQ